ncbi:hypothetical protein IKS86_04400 [bacterium]|nr:hypothetical protein [bacterium]
MAKVGVISRTNAGELVYGADRINQQIDMILQTPKSAVVGDPGMGVRDDIMDIPSTKLVSTVVQDLNRQLALYIPDVKVDKVKTTVENGRALLVITWTYKSGKNGGGELVKEL